MAIGDKARAAREEQGLDPRPITQIRAETPEPEPEPEPEPVPEPTPTDPISMLVSALDRFRPAPGITKEDLSDVMRENTEGMRKALKPENTRHPDVSVFNPLGERDHPRPKLKRKTFMIGIELDEAELDLDEIDLLNKFEHTKEARNGRWRGEVRRLASGSEELHILFPATTIDDRSELPQAGLKAILTELHGGARAADEASLIARVASLERELEAQKALQTA